MTSFKRIDTAPCSFATYPADLALLKKMYHTEAFGFVPPSSSGRGRRRGSRLDVHQGSGRDDDRRCMSDEDAVRETSRSRSRERYERKVDALCEQLEFCYPDLPELTSVDEPEDEDRHSLDRHSLDDSALDQMYLGGRSSKRPEQRERRPTRERRPKPDTPALRARSHSC